MAWFDDVIAAHTAVTNAVSHIERMNSDRYFVWEEDEHTDLLADNRHVETSRVIITDLFTVFEFDPWVSEFSASLDENGYAYHYDFIEREVDTRIYHHQWTWYING